MADDSDVPPLEDMTEVLKQADAVRQARESVQHSGKLLAKERAKVKKNVTAKAVSPQVQDAAASGDHKLSASTQAADEGVSVTGTTSSSTPAATTASSTSSSSDKTSKSSGGMFGGMKKGFLFGNGPSKAAIPYKAKNKEVTQTKDTKATTSVKKETVDSKPEKEDIPYISPKTGKSESGLTLNEVQQAMSEAKELLDNQDWINDELLDKVEKNELLLKRFGDPYFMKALEEFQTAPQAAMEKYKGNKEVEKFMTEFCGLLGDHFSNQGTALSSSSAAKSTSYSTNSTATSRNFVNASKSSKPTITEITDNGTDSANGSEHSDTFAGQQKTPKIIEISDDKPGAALSEPLKELKTPDSVAKSTKSAAQILTHCPTEKADIQEMQPQQMDDAEVKKILEDPKVMEILVNPKIVNLIQLLRSDPDKAHRIVDRADSDLKDKIRFLVSKGLLQIQTG